MEVSAKQSKKKGNPEEKTAIKAECIQKVALRGKSRPCMRKVTQNIKEAKVTRKKTIVAGAKSVKASLMNKKEGAHMAVRANINRKRLMGVIEIPYVLKCMQLFSVRDWKSRALQM